MKIPSPVLLVKEVNNYRDHYFRGPELLLKHLANQPYKRFLFTSCNHFIQHTFFRVYECNIQPAAVKIHSERLTHCQVNMLIPENVLPDIKCFECQLYMRQVYSMVFCRDSGRSQFFTDHLLQPVIIWHFNMIQYIAQDGKSQISLLFCLFGNLFSPRSFRWTFGTWLFIDSIHPRNDAIGVMLLLFFRQILKRPVPFIGYVYTFIDYMTDLMYECIGPLFIIGGILKKSFIYFHILHFSQCDRIVFFNPGEMEFITGGNKRNKLVYLFKSGVALLCFL